MIKKCGDAMFPDAQEILDGACVILPPVPLIQSLKPLARHFIALKTVFACPTQGLAAGFHFAACAGRRLAGISGTAAGTGISVTQMSRANAAVDAARRYELGLAHKQ